MDDAETSKIDYSMFDNSDLLNFILQRSKILFDIPQSGRIIKDWSNGDDTTLETIVAAKGAQLAERTIEIISQEFNELRAILDPIAPNNPNYG